MTFKTVHRPEERLQNKTHRSLLQIWTVHSNSSYTLWRMQVKVDQAGNA